MRSLVAAFRFLTRIPVPGPDTLPADITRAVPWFPLVGALVGLATAAVFHWGTRLWPPAVAGVLAVAVGLMITGGFHEDGATDATDGLGGGWTRERVMEIMKDSRIGAYGAMALWCLLSFRWAALVALGPKAWVALPLAMVLGRWSISLVLLSLPTISEGLAKEVHKGLAPSAFLGSSLLAVLGLAAGWRLGLPHVLGTGAAALGTTILWIGYLKRRLGGHSGDLLGAGNQLVEAATLLVCLAGAG